MSKFLPDKGLRGHRFGELIYMALLPMEGHELAIPQTLFEISDEELESRIIGYLWKHRAGEEWIAHTREEARKKGGRREHIKPQPNH